MRLKQNNRKAKPDGKVQLRGTVAGVDACRILTDLTEFTVGSGLACDLVVHDPLVPREAFVLRYTNVCEHSGPQDQPGWIIEPEPGARVYVNNSHTRCERLFFGDIVSVGCHRFHFEDGDALARPNRADTQVDDLCAQLLSASPIPVGYLNGGPNWRDRERARKAMSLGLVLTALLLLTLLFKPESKFESNFPTTPTAVAITPRQTLVATGEGAINTKSLGSVMRKAFNSETAPPQPTDLNSVESSIAEMAVAPLTPTDVETSTQAPAPMPVTAEAVEAGPKLGTLSVALESTPQVEVQRTQSALTSNAVARRTVVAPAAGPIATAADLAGAAIRTDQALPTAAAVSTKYAEQLSQERAAAPAKAQSITGTSAQALADIAAYKPSALNYEQYKGNRIPVAHMPESLLAVATPGAADGVKDAKGGGGAGATGDGAGKAGEGKGIVLDGQISEQEVSISWKSGAFRLHAPGDPPVAKPETYCYVGAAEEGGRKYLYISFLCTDPNTDQIIANYAKQGESSGPESSLIIRDDTVEIFLDTKFHRKDYYQLIVNAHGAYWGAYCPGPDVMQTSGFQPFKPDLKVKTTINKQAGNWVCEVLVPFDQIGGVPEKGSRWAVNFCRNFRGQGDDTQLQTWFLVYDKTRNFHRPELFGVFQW